MGVTRYRGTVNTVETAKLAHRVLTITCLDCSRQTNRWAYTICQRGEAWGKLPLKTPVWGFYCRDCRRSVLVILEASGPWDR